MTDTPNRATARARPAIFMAVAAVVVAFDQLTKTWALHHAAHHSIHLVWTLRLALSFNRGAAFGLGAGMGPFLLVAGALVAVGFFILGRSSMSGSVLLTVALGLVLGGAAGNLVDRVVRHNGGAVIDFIDLQWWPIFNVADSAISVGAVLLVVGARRPA